MNTAFIKKAICILAVLAVLLGACFLLFRKSDPAISSVAPARTEETFITAPDLTEEPAPDHAEETVQDLPEEMVQDLTEGSTPEPSSEITDAPFIPANVDEAIERYEESPVAFKQVTHAKTKPNESVAEPRYTLGTDGIYHSSIATNDNEAVIMLTGDLMCQKKQQRAVKTASGYDFNGSFYFVKSIFSTADLVVGNLETTLSESAPYMTYSIRVEGRPHLNAPAAFLEAVRYAGFDMVVMSNNHNCDSGVRGIYETLDHTDEYGLIHTGLYRNLNEPRFCIIDVDGIKIAVLSYATYFNTKDEHLTQEGRDAMLNAYSPDKVARDSAAARKSGAEYVIVYIHWGTEYTNEPSNRQYTYAQEIADAGADYIIGSHPHALQPYDTVTSSDGRVVPVVYSMGNFVSHQKMTVTKDTIILRIVLGRAEDGSVELREEGYIPCLVFTKFHSRSYTVVPVVKPYNDGLTSDHFAPAYERITGIIGNMIDILGTQ